MRSTKKQLGLSILSLILCFAMLIGTTFAWFTDSVTSGTNKITAGNLDIEMYWTDDYEKAEAGTGEWYNIEDPEHDVVFDYDKWEPGYTELRYVKIKNTGSLAFKYQLGIAAAGTVGKLAEVIDVYFIPEVSANIDTHAKLFHVDENNARPTVGTLKNILANQNTGTVNPEGSLYPAGASFVPAGADQSEVVVAVAFKMQEEAGNEYKNETIGEGFYITAVATQLAFEQDSFDALYDEDLAFPALVLPENVSEKAELDENNKVKSDTVLDNGTSVSATVPAGVEMDAGTEEIVMTVKEVKKDEGNITADDTVISKTLDVHVEGVASGNTTPILVRIKNALPSGMNRSAVVLYHTENGEKVKMTSKASLAEVTKHNDYYFDTDGNLTMALAQFSEILLKVDASDPWGGETKTDWYNDTDTIFTISTAEQLAGLAALVNGGNDFAGKTIVLDKSIVLNNWKVGETFYTPEELHGNNSPVYYPSNGANAQSNGGTNGDKPYYFTPIGTDKHPFKGTFNGDGHYISGLYRIHYGENNGYDNAYIGVFGCVDGATVKNLTVKDGFVESFGGLVGVVAATAKGNCTFENIKIRNNYILTYNEYLGGVVGYYGAGTGTFEDISVDTTNNFGALWGTYDLPCGGIIGGIGSKTNVSLKSCSVSPSMELYNDCCANYQWFAYRYSGMLVGYLPGSNIASFAQSHITCKDVSVYYGDWTSEYYCELRSLGKGSYNGETEWKYTKINRTAGAAGNCGYNHTENNKQTTTWRGTEYGPNEAHEDHCCVNIAFKQLFGGGQGVYGVETHTGVNIAEKGSISVKFPNTDKYLYRVGNMNTVALGSLFEKVQNTLNIDANAVDITAEQIAGVTSVEYVKNSDWTKSTLQFSGTGVVKLTLEYLTQEPIELNLEVVDAMNATTATSATANNVVLLKDVSGSSIDVSNGYTFYGNGFKINFSGTGSRNSSAGYAEGFVNITNGGILDNTQVICKVFPKAYLYKSSGTEYITESSNVVSSTDTTHYKYQWSAVAISGDGSTISNSYIYGARNNVYIGNGNVSLENCVLECGALANIQIISDSQSTVSLKDLTTVQYLTEDGFDVGNKMFGGAILLGAGDKENMATEENPKIVVLGSFDQFNWVSNTESNQVSGSTQKQIANLALNQSKYSHNGYVNMGIVCLNNNTLNITGLPQGYSKSTVSFVGSSGQVYSLESGYGTVDTSYNSNNKYPYQSSVQGLALPSIDYQTSDERLTVSKTPSSISIIAKLDAGETYNFNFSDLSLSVGGNNLNYTVKDTSGATVDKMKTVSLTNSGDTVYTLTASADAGYNPDGTVKSETRDISVKLTISISLAETPAPEWSSQPSGTPIYVGTTKGSDWSIAVPVLDGAKIKYWSTDSNSLKELDLSTISGVTKTTNNSLTITGSDYKLELTSTAIKATKTNMWVMAAGKLYVTVSATSDYVSTSTTSRSTTVTYKFTANSKADAPVSTSKYFSANVPATNDKTYKYGDLTSGKLTELTSGGGGGGCLIPGTLITMADGTQKPVEEIKAGDMLLTWDLTAGTYGAKPVVFNDYEEAAECDVIYVTFSDGTEIGVVSEHGFFDKDLGKYVYLDENAAQYLGHAFIKEDGSTVTLTDVEIKHEYTKYYSPTTFGDLCYYTNGMLSMPGGISGLFNIFDVDTDTMKYDEAKMRADIKAYGLLDIDAFGGMITEDMFEAFNGEYLGVAVGKGNLTWEYIAYLAERYAPLCK